MLSTGRSSTETCSIVGFSASAGSSASASATLARSRVIASRAVGAGDELDRDDREAVERGAVDRLQPLQAGQLGLDLVGDLLLDRLRVGARPGRGDRRLRNVEVGQRLLDEREVRHHAAEGEQRDEQDAEGGLEEEEARQCSGVGDFGGLALGLVRRAWWAASGAERVVGCGHLPAPSPGMSSAISEAPTRRASARARAPDRRRRDRRGLR